MSEAMKGEAVEWFVRLRAREISDDERDAYAAWLAESPAHREAMDAVEEQWGNLRGLAPWAQVQLQQLEDNRDSHRYFRSNKRLVGFAATAAVVLAILFVIPALWLGKGGHFVTEQGEQRQVVLEDGSRVRLNSSSAVEVHFNRKEREVRLRRGESLFDVAHDSGRPFVVQLPGSKVVAVGTRFNIRFVGEELAVTVLEGKVLVIPDDVPVRKQFDADLLLVPNQQARITLAGEVEAISPVDAARLTAWDKGLLIFDNTPLRQVVEELSRYVSGEIRIAAGVPDHPVTGTIKIRDKETMLSILAEVAPVTPVRTSATVTTLTSSAPQSLHDSG